MVASLVLVPVAVLRGEHKTLDRSAVLKLVFLGITGYSMAQGLQCLGLYHLPAVTVTFILNSTPVMVLLLGYIFFRTPPPTPRQVAGVALVVAGAHIYFGGVPADSLSGVVITLARG